MPNSYIQFSNPVSVTFTTIPAMKPMTMKSLFSNNSAVYYKPGSLVSGGVGTVRNARMKWKNT